MRATHKLTATLVVMLAAHTAFGQTSNVGTMSVTVLDPAGASIPGASSGNCLADRVVGGWTLGTIIFVQSGNPSQLGGGFNTVNARSGSRAGALGRRPTVTRSQGREE